MITKSRDKLDTFWVDVKQGHFKNRQNIFLLTRNSFPYSADVKPEVSKSWFDFI